MALQGAKFGFALSWDQVPGSAADLDLQGVIFDGSGKLLDAVYYNNMKALGKCVTHSGDETTGERSGFDEVIWVHAGRLPPEVTLVVLVAACFRGGMIRNAVNGKFHILEDQVDKQVGVFGLEGMQGQAVLLGGLVRAAGGWSFRPGNVVVSAGEHFIDLLEPVIGNFVRSIIPAAPRRIKAAFAMEKGSVVDLPAHDAQQSCMAGLGWDTSMGQVDLDVSAVMLDQECRFVDAVFFAEPEKQGIKHSGDNLTGDGSGDDETIVIQFNAVPAHVVQIFFVINIYTAGKTFAQVANPYCRLVLGAGEEFCRYQLSEAGHEQGLVMARLFRLPGTARWGFQAIGMPCGGRTIKEPSCMNIVLQQARRSPAELAMTDGAARSAGRPF